MLKIIKKSYHKTKKILNKKMITRTCLLFLIIMFIISGLNGAFWQKESAGKGWLVHDSDEPVVRVHIRAHDDSPEEQALKNRVRDDFLALTAHYRAKKSRQAVTEAIEREIHLLEEALNRKMSGYGSTENRVAEVKLQKEYFPLRHYGEKVYPPGEYTALIVTIGAGEGENWWCLLYPPLCFPLARENEENKQDNPDAENDQEAVDNREVVEALAAFNRQSPGDDVPCETEKKEKEEKEEGRWKIKVWEWIKSLFEKE